MPSLVAQPHELGNLTKTALAIRRQYFIRANHWRFANRNSYRVQLDYIVRIVISRLELMITLPRYGNFALCHLLDDERVKMPIIDLMLYDEFLSKDTARDHLSVSVRYVVRHQ